MDDPGEGLGPTLAELDLEGLAPDPLARPRKIVHTAFERDLVAADLEALRDRPPSPVAKSLVRIHSSHHSLARCLAAGMKTSQAALVTGYSPGRISDLQRDPTFKALVDDYRQEVRAWFADYGERMHEMGLDALEILHERLHNDPGEFSVPMLLELVRTVADRTGHGPGSNLSVSISRDVIDRPPRETFEDWQARRERELGSEEPKQLEPPKKTLN